LQSLHQGLHVAYQHPT